jgi:hypothetical protein
VLQKKQQTHPPPHYIPLLFERIFLIDGPHSHPSHS